MGNNNTSNGLVNITPYDITFVVANRAQTSRAKDWCFWTLERESFRFFVLLPLYKRIQQHQCACAATAPRTTTIRISKLFIFNKRAGWGIFWDAILI